MDEPETVELVGGPTDGKVYRMPRPGYVMPAPPSPADLLRKHGVKFTTWRYVETGCLTRAGHREAVYIATEQP